MMCVRSKERRSLSSLEREKKNNEHERTNFLFFHRKKSLFVDFLFVIIHIVSFVVRPSVVGQEEVDAPTDTS